MALGRNLARRATEDLNPLLRGASPALNPLLRGASPAVSPLLRGAAQPLGALRGVSRSLGSVPDASPAPAPAPRPELTQNQLWLLGEIQDIRASQSARLLELEREIVDLSAQLSAAQAAHRDCIAECNMEYVQIGFKVVTTLGALGWITLYLLKQ
ncbi:hypothetical protein EJB05_47664, partial [Eragrostis curvula]